MKALDPNLSALVAVLFSYLKQAISCAFLSSAWTLFESWEPKLPDHFRKKRITSAVRQLAEEYRIRVRFVPGVYEIRLRLPAILYVKTATSLDQLVRLGLDNRPFDTKRPNRIFLYHQDRDKDFSPDITHPDGFREEVARRLRVSKEWVTPSLMPNPAHPIYCHDGDGGIVEPFRGYYDKACYADLFFRLLNLGMPPDGILPSLERGRYCPRFAKHAVKYAIKLGRCNPEHAIDGELSFAISNEPRNTSPFLERNFGDDPHLLFLYEVVTA